jgi:hypothetical protein
VAKKRELWKLRGWVVADPYTWWFGAGKPRPDFRFAERAGAGFAQQGGAAGFVRRVALWQSTPRGFKWAKILFVLQVPVFHVARLTYAFSNGISFRVMVGSTTHYIGGDIGSSMSLALSPESLGFMFGINIVAVLALLYLTRASRPAPAGVDGGASARAHGEHCAEAV